MARKVVSFLHPRGQMPSKMLRSLVIFTTKGAVGKRWPSWGHFHPEEGVPGKGLSHPLQDEAPHLTLLKEDDQVLVYL